MDVIVGIMTLILLVSLGSCWGYDNSLNDGKRAFIKEHQESPYCMESSATVLDKTVTIKRCFIAKELKLLEK